MAKEKQKMTLNVRKRETSVASAPPPIDPAKIEAFASGSTDSKEPAKKAIAPVEDKTGNSVEQKVIRDAFTMPSEDHELFADIQKKCLSLGIVTTKSEIVRAGLKHLASLDNGKLEKIIKAVPKLKTGRPSTNSK